MKQKVLSYIEFIKNSRLGSDILEKKYAAKFIENKKTDTQLYLFIREGTLHIVFRGTEIFKLQDWLTDTDFAHKVIPYGNTESPIRVHGGFLKAYKSVRDEIHKYIKDNSYYFDTILCLGHSMGGALATLAAIDCQFWNTELYYEVWTFGAPRIGNRAFAFSFNKRIPAAYRVYISNDVVPKLPPMWFEIGSGGFMHSGLSVRVGPINFWDTFLDFVQSLGRLQLDLTHHSLDLYKKFCRKDLTRPW